MLFHGSPQPATQGTVCLRHIKKFSPASTNQLETLNASDVAVLLAQELDRVTGKIHHEWWALRPYD